MDIGQDPYEIAADLSRKPHKILIAIRSRGGTAKTSMITEDTDLDGGTVNYYYKQLMRANLIERIDENDSGSGIPREGYTYQITERGNDVLTAAQEDYSLDPLEEGVVRRRFDDLEARVEAVEEDIQEMRGEGRSTQSDPNLDALEKSTFDLLADPNNI
ncbi:hypothetical protein [Natronococcus wangiae]|uniref:hypothetical protein n=1 Tax=Natronococcus wangiae TaxID=3068275 RepID=UPI00273DAB84|nr:hypothetical protein [Natronococcus sp. AD5]